MDSNLDTADEMAQTAQKYNALWQLEHQQEEMKVKKSYWRAYILSLVIPPIGIYFFIKFYFFGEGYSGDRKAAVFSLILTAVSLLLNIWFIRVFFHQTLPGNSNELNYLKELITPENQKTLKQLLK